MLNIFSQFQLQVLVSDNGAPVLSSTTRVVVQVEDVNDHAPEFDQKLYKVQIPANAKVDQALFQVSVLKPFEDLTASIASFHLMFPSIVVTAC